MQDASQDRSPGSRCIAQLLSGHQTAAAAVLAASMGDVRLASLLAQVSHCLSDMSGFQLPKYCTIWPAGRVHEKYISGEVLMSGQLSGGVSMQGVAAQATLAASHASDLAAS